MKALIYDGDFMIRLMKQSASHHKRVGILIIR